MAIFEQHRPQSLQIDKHEKSNLLYHLHIVKNFVSEFTIQIYCFLIFFCNLKAESFGGRILLFFSESNPPSMGGSRKKLLKFSPFERITTVLRRYAEFTCHHTQIHNSFSLSYNLVFILLNRSFPKTYRGYPDRIGLTALLPLAPHPSLRECGSLFPTRRST